MKFEIPASQRDLKITKTALALSGIADIAVHKLTQKAIKSRKEFSENELRLF